MRILLVIMMVLVAAGGAAAGDWPLAQGGERQLNGHGFLPSLYVSEPWVGSMFQNFTGGAVAVGLETPFLDADGTPLYTLEGDLFYANLGLGYQQHLGERLAVGVKFDAMVRTGTNAQTLITEGAIVDRTMNLWFKYMVTRTEASQLTMGLDWEYRKTFIVSPYSFAQGLLNGEELDEADLLNSVKNWTSRLTLDYAHAFSPTFGVRANAAVGLYEVPLANSVSKATHRVGVLGEMDLMPSRGVPIGFTLGYTKGFPTDDPGAGLAGALFGIWYTGREEFVVGIETGFMTAPVLGQEKDIDAMFGVFTIRYYF